MFRLLLLLHALTTFGKILKVTALSQLYQFTEVHVDAQVDAQVDAPPVSS